MLSEMGFRSMIGSGGGDGFAGEDFEKELASLLREQRRQEATDRERELNIFRSGSAPPTVEGAVSAVGGIFSRDVAHVVSDFSEAKNVNAFLSEEELRSNPAYLSYYYSHANLNPRLPPPLLSKEDWRSTQKLQTGVSAWGGIGDRRKVSREEERGTKSLFSQQPGFNSQDEALLNPRKAPGSGEWIDEGDGLIGLSLGRQKSFADILQDDLGRRTPNPGHSSRPSSRNAFVNDLEALSYTDSQLSLDNDVASLDGQRHDEYIHSASGPQNIVASSASAIGSSLRRSHTPDPQLITRVPSPSLPPVGTRINTNDKKVTNSLSSFNGASCTVEPADIVTAMSNISLSTANAKADENISNSKLQKGVDEHQNYLFPSQSGENNDKSHHVLKDSDPEYLRFSSFPQSLKPSSSGSAKSSGSQLELRNSGSKIGGLVESQRSNALSSKSYLKSSLPSVAGSGGPLARYPNPDNPDMAFTNYGLNSYSFNPTVTSVLGTNAGSSVLGNHVGSGNSPLFEGTAATSTLGGIFAPPNLAGTTDLYTRSRIGNQAAGAALQTPLNDPLYLHYLKAAEYTSQLASTYSNPSLERGYGGNPYSDLVGLQKAYIESLLQSQKQYGMPLLDKMGSLTQGYYGNPALGIGMTYPGSPLASPIASSIGPGSPLRLNDRNMHFPSNMRNLNGGSLSSWRSDSIGTTDEHFPSTLLEEFKGSKNRGFELAEISGHVVEFSADQYGSRFIQQKLETATTEEKTMVFEEIMPHAHSLMTDVFGNYVVQKFLEHGSAAQRRELADQLNGHVLTLSLQMYGCRVIQKAIEVVDLDQKTKMVLELDGHVMRCVRDQNGNHVIQKCIECVPQEAIQFIITTFYDQVVTLSTHPYGCRVIQRVLEHCDDPKTQEIVMDEILQSVCMLAQDQYGNYVVQHVLEHGKPHERSAIIKKLAGQIVQMSQQKFASNVVEKCLTFGGLEERQLLVTEMLGSTDENEPLQAMMKDQFANYVVQKVLETCDDQQRELILTRIKVHLSALKKYTYGKHIVARVEKLVAAGEKRIGLQSS